jgi:TonB family protein
MNDTRVRKCAWWTAALVVPVIVGCTQIPRRPHAPDDDDAVATQPQQTPTPQPLPRALPPPEPAPEPQRDAKGPKPRSIDLDTASCPTPNYPPYAQDEEARGVTRVQFSVNAAGYVTEASVVKPSGTTTAHRVLDQTALTAALGCRFTPMEGFGPAQAVRSFRWVFE